MIDHSHNHQQQWQSCVSKHFVVLFMVAIDNVHEFKYFCKPFARYVYHISADFCLNNFSLYFINGRKVVSRGSDTLLAPAKRSFLFFLNVINFTVLVVNHGIFSTKLFMECSG